MLADLQNNMPYSLSERVQSPALNYQTLTSSNSESTRRSETSSSTQHNERTVRSGLSERLNDSSAKSPSLSNPHSSASGNRSRVGGLSNLGTPLVRNKRTANGNTISHAIVSSTSEENFSPDSTHVSDTTYIGENPSPSGNTDSGKGASSPGQSTQRVDPTPQRRSLRIMNRYKQTANNAASSSSARPITDSIASRDFKKPTGFAARRAVSGKTPAKHLNLSTASTQTSNSSSKKLRKSRPPPTIDLKKKESLLWVLKLLKTLAGGYYLALVFDCSGALRLYNHLPLSQKESPWVLCQIGKAHFERASYTEAAKYFARAHYFLPESVDCMDIYSTTLWHLKDAVKLGHLAHELMDFDRSSPEAWCVMGNSFSLEKDRFAALKCFQKATKINPKYAYAFALQGHEHYMSEQYDLAMHTYNCGVSLDSRQYTGWCGMGLTKLALKDYDEAETYFTWASRVNPDNAIIMSYIGKVRYLITI